MATLDVNRPVQLRNGSSAYIKRVLINGLIIGESYISHEDELFCWFSDGRMCSSEDSPYDLVNVPEPVPAVDYKPTLGSYYQMYMQTKELSEFHLRNAERYEKLAISAQERNTQHQELIAQLRVELSDSKDASEERDSRIKQLENDLFAANRRITELDRSKSSEAENEVERLTKQLRHAAERFKLLKNYLNSKSIGELIHDGEVKKLYP